MVSVTECETPVDVTVTGIEYVPGGVLFALFWPVDPLAPPSELVQLETPALITAAISAISSSFRRRRSVSGRRMSAQARGQYLPPRDGASIRAVAPVEPV